MLGSTTRVGPTTPALVTLHSLPTAHPPPSASWPRRPRRRRLEGHDEIAPPARPARPERAPAAAAASSRPRQRSRGRWSSYWSLLSSGARSHLRLILLPNGCATRFGNTFVTLPNPAHFTYVLNTYTLYSSQVTSGNPAGKRSDYYHLNGRMCTVMVNAAYHEP